MVPRYEIDMANQPDSNKRVLSIRIQRDLYKRAQKKAKSLDMDLSEFVTYLLYKGASDVELTSEEVMQIAKEIEYARNRKN